MPCDEPDDINEILGTQRRERRWPRRLLIGLTLAALALTGLWRLWPTPGAGASVGFRTAAVGRGGLEIIVSATGTLEPVTQVDVGTEVSGTIRSVTVDFNDSVRKGQVLAVLDCAKLEAQRDEAAASLALAKADLLNAQAVAAEAGINLNRLARAYELSKGRLPSAQDLDAARAERDKARAKVGVAEATIAKARASLKACESDLGKAVIVAPIDGMILDRQVEPGQTVAASLSAPTLFTMAENLASMTLSVAVDEADVGQVKEGQRATFVVDAYPDRRFPARITQVRYAPQDSSGVVTYECLLAVDNSDLSLRPGMTATAHIVTTEVSDALLAPNLALRFTPLLPAGPEAERESDGRSLISKLMPGPPRAPRWRKQAAEAGRDVAGSMVWVLEGGRPLAREVVTGPSDGVRTQIVSGALREGDLVLIGQEAANQ